MLNFRKLKQDFSSNVLQEGRQIFETQKVLSAKIVSLDAKTLRIHAKILGQYDNTYETEIEIDRLECEMIDSDCDCPHHFDCQHITALLYYLEIRLDQILVEYSKESEPSDEVEIDQTVIAEFKKAEKKEELRREEAYQHQVIEEYLHASELLAKNPFFRPDLERKLDTAEMCIIFQNLSTFREERSLVEVQLALRLQNRSKPIYVAQIRPFIEALRFEEPISIGGRPHRFSISSFPAAQRDAISILMSHVRYPEGNLSERQLRIGGVDVSILGDILACAYNLVMKEIPSSRIAYDEDDLPSFNYLFDSTLENPVRYSPQPANIHFELEYLQPPLSKLLMKPKLQLAIEFVDLNEIKLLLSTKPGLISKGAYYRFHEKLSRKHLMSLRPFEDAVIPEPLLGTFIENSLPELLHYSQVEKQECLENFCTLPFTGQLKGECRLSFLDGELDAELWFHYGKDKISACSTKVNYQDVKVFKTEDGIIARNLVEEQMIIEELFQDFTYVPEQAMWSLKSEKKIVEFMTEILPRNQYRVHFDCPQNLLDQVLYDQTRFYIEFTPSKRIDQYLINLRVDGCLKGVKVDLLWDCLASRKSYIEMETPKSKVKKSVDSGKLPKIIVLDLDKTSKLVQLFDELGIQLLQDSIIERPIWSLVSLDTAYLTHLPIEFKISPVLLKIRDQMLGQEPFEPSIIPQEIKAVLRPYQKEGIAWIERLRKMYLCGILADDMGLGKTLQAIVALTQRHAESKVSSLIVCPTSLVYNWKEELHRFSPGLKVMVVDGIPQVRKKMIDQLQEYDVVITSYSLLQKDVDHYKEFPFAYLILDEAQQIKNRGTRNAKSVKALKGENRLVLSGTPIENSLEELWSLFDFLMPGFLSTFERFIAKYIHTQGKEHIENLEYLKRKIAPFVLRRMKSDVLDDLPPVSELIYHCQLTPSQMELYRAYAESARNELVRLVEKEGFDKVQIHVLATLTRLKQICCHPAIFAKETVESGDSAKYDLFLDLIDNLVESKHKTVVFSQYTKMLKIMRKDLEDRGIRLLYLDGSSQNRLEIVKDFNDRDEVSVFLVSLKAGGTGLNLVSADTVIHYDMWWNPAVESQATDRVHRIGQKRSVSSFKLITLGTIEEKIAEMQKRKKGLVKKIVSCDDEAVAKLTWEDVLELLKT